MDVLSSINADNLNNDHRKLKPRTAIRKIVLSGF